MCGIAGILRIAPVVSPEVAVPEHWLDLMEAAVAPRGPDGSGRWRTRVPGPEGLVTHVAFVHRRMAIIDLAGGGQPMVLPSRGEGAGELAVTFNGCIYNHRSLRDELRGLGHEFRTDHSDTEVLLHGQRQWGRGLHERLEGMYAAGIWDGSERSLVLMRDLTGEKPLYFAEVRTGGGVGSGDPAARGVAMVIFASSARAVYETLCAVRRETEGQRWDEKELRSIDAALEIDAEAMARWIGFGWDEGTPWAGIRELKPGQVAWFDSLGRSGRRRQSIEAEAKRSLPLDAATAWSMIERSVEQRLEADVALGCFLSGGIDSGLIAAAAQRALSKRGERLRTFTMRMPDAAYDESALAAETAAHLGTEHTTLDVERNVAGDLQSLIEWMGLPFGDSSILPTYWLSRAVRERVKVALSGDGGDELFAGYERHAAAPLLRRYRLLWRAAGTLPWRNGAPKSVWSKIARMSEAASGTGYADLIAIFPSAMMRQLTRSDREQRDAAFEVPQLPHRRDLETYLPGDLLRKVDTASMRVALEVRAPMLDRELVYRASATAPDVLMKGGRKGMLREAARVVLPQRVVDARKSGFAIPIGEWFREAGELRAMLHDRVQARDAFDGMGLEFDRMCVDRMLEEHETGRRDHSQRLFVLLSTAVWNRWRSSHRA